MKDGKEYYDMYYEKLLEFINHKEKIIWEINDLKSQENNKAWLDIEFSEKVKSVY